MSDFMELRIVVGVLRRQIKFILAIALILTSLALLGVYSLPKKYSSSSLILIDTSSKNILDPNREISNGFGDNARVESEVKILQSDAVLLQTVKNANLVSDNEFGVKLNSMDKFLSKLGLRWSKPPHGDMALSDVLKSFRDAVKIEREGLTYLISVTVTSKDNSKAAKLSNELASAYIERQISAKFQSAMGNRDALERQIAIANAALIENDRKFDNFIESNFQRMTETSKSAVLGDLRRRLKMVRADRLNEQQRLTSLNSWLERGDLNSLTSTLSSDAATQLKSQRDALQAKIASVASDANQSIDLRKELQQIEASLLEEAKKETNQIDASIKKFDAEENAMRDQVKSAVLNSELPRDVLLQAFMLQQASETARTQYQALLMRAQQLSTEASLQFADSQVVSQALPQSEPSFPNTRLILIFSTFFSVLFGFVLAFLREYFVGGFASEDQVEAILGTSLASTVPRETSGAEGNDLSASVVTSPLSRFSESIRRIHMSIDQALYKSGQADNGVGKVIMVSSSLPSEGKTTIAMSVARAYARSGKRTLLIDCDLRKPDVHRTLEMEPSFSFLETLQGNNPTGVVKNLIVQDPSSSLSIVLGGRPTDFSVDELLMSHRIEKVISSARRSFDYVVLDTSPISPVVDGLYLARYVDVVVFVVKWASTSQALARQSVSRLLENVQSGVRILPVLNHQERSGWTAGREEFGAYYS
jgi:succinoglycan biosynthesis transport protein ExoP